MVKENRQKINPGNDLKLWNKKDHLCNYLTCELVIEGLSNEPYHFFILQVRIRCVDIGDAYSLRLLIRNVKIFARLLFRNKRFLFQKRLFPMLRRILNSLKRWLYRHCRFRLWCQYCARFNCHIISGIQIAEYVFVNISFVNIAFAKRR